MTERNIERALLAAERETAKELRKAEQQARRAANAKNAMPGDSTVAEPVLTDPNLPI